MPLLMTSQRDLMLTMLNDQCVRYPRVYGFFLLL
jgi:hypothetical protein